MEDEEVNATKHGHVTSLSVLRTHRKCGLATALMNSSHKRMVKAISLYLIAFVQVECYFKDQFVGFLSPSLRLSLHLSIYLSIYLTTPPLPCLGFLLC
jgi:hypothetical protein